MNAAAFNATDWVLLGVVLLSVLLGVWRGLVREVMSLLGWVVAFVLAQRFASLVGNSLPLDGLSDGWRWAAGFALVFVGTVITAALFGGLIQRVSAAVGLRPVDRVLGALFGGLRGVLLLLLVGFGVNVLSLAGQPWWRESQMALQISRALGLLQPLLPDMVVRHLF